MNFLRHPSPYLLLSLTSLFWAANWVVGRAMRDEMPPVAMGFWRWTIALLILLPFAAPELRRKRDVVRANWLTLTLLGVLGAIAFNTLIYVGLQYTAATNGVLFNSISPVLIILLSWVISRERISKLQACGVVLSLCGVLVILLHGDLTALSSIEFNKGDIIFTVALAIFGLYSVLSLKRPQIHGLSFVGFTFGCGAVCLVPLWIWELFTRPAMQLNAANLLSLFYVAVFPSTLAYLCFNRGVQLIGANRAAPFFHVVPVFGTVMSIAFLGEHPQAFQFIGFALVLTGVFVASRKASA